MFTLSVAKWATIQIKTILRVYSEQTWCRRLYNRKVFVSNKFNLFFLFIISFLTVVLFWPVFLQSKIPFNGNLLASFYNPWAQEKFPGWEQGIPNKPTGKDDLLIFYPQRTFTTSVLKSGQIPFWNPYAFSGNYHLGLSETAVFYPLNLLFLTFPQIDVWIFLIIIEPIIAGMGMYLFLKRIVKYERSAILGALAFAFSGIVIVRSIEGLSVGHSLIWIPYVFWAVESFSKTKKIRFLWISLLSLFFSLLAGWFQFTFYIFVFALIYSLARLYWKKDRTKFDFLILTPFLILPLITLFHTIPTFQALLEASRSALEANIFSYQHLVPVTHILTLIIPDFWGNPAVYNFIGKSEYKESIMFIGVVPLLFSLISVFKKKKKEELFFIGGVLFSLVLAIDNPFSKLIIKLPLPVLSSFLPDRIFLITTLSLCVLAAYGFDFLIRGKKEIVLKAIKKSFSFLWIIIFVLFFFILFNVLKDPGVLSRVDPTGINRNIEAIQFRNSIVPIFFLFIITFLFLIFRNRFSKNIFFFAIIAALFLQSFLFAHKYIPFSYPQFVFTNHPVFSYLEKRQELDRFVSIGNGHVVPNVPLQFRLNSPEGVGSMYIRRYGEFVSYMKSGEIKIPDKVAFDLEIYPQDAIYPKNERLHRFYELTSVKYIVSDNKSMVESSVVSDMNVFPLIWKNDKWLVYQYKKSMPRFFVTSSFKVIKNDKEILNSLFGKDFVPNRIILEEYPGFNSTDSSGSAKIIDYSPNKISAKVNTGNDSLFYLSDNYSKMFKVFIDGKEGKILRANYTFRAVPVPKGEHLVEMKYDDRSFVLGIKIAIITLSALGILTFVLRKYI